MGLAFPEPHESGGMTGYLRKIADVRGKGGGVGAGWPPMAAAPGRLHAGPGAIGYHRNPEAHF